MINRLVVTPLALAGALLGASVGAFAQSQAGPAPGSDMPPGQYQQGAPYGAGQMGPDGQPGPNGPARPNRNARMKMALRSLDLNPAQKGQIRDIMRQFRESQQSPTPMTRRQMLQQIRSVLNPQQLAQFRAAMHHPMAPQGYGPQGQMPPGYGPQGPGGPPDQGQYGPPGPGQNPGSR
jgi:Spy/CpxP family protein refolding chaperone